MRGKSRNESENRAALAVSSFSTAQAMTLASVLGSLPCMSAGCQNEGAELFTKKVFRLENKLWISGEKYFPAFKTPLYSQWRGTC